MKKVILILVAALTLVACKNKNQNTPNTNSPGVENQNIVKQIVIDTNSICYQESFVFDILVTHNDGGTETIKGLSEQPNVAECPKGTGTKWCLLDEKTDAVLTKDVKSFKVLVYRFDSTQYFICHDNGNR